MLNFLKNTQKIKPVIVAMLLAPSMISFTQCSEDKGSIYLNALHEGNAEIFSNAPADELRRCRSERSNWSLLYGAACTGCLNIIRVLAEKCPEMITERNQSGHTPLIIALRNKHYDAALLLAEQTPDFPKITAKKDSPYKILLKHYQDNSNLLKHETAFCRLWALLIQSSDLLFSYWTFDTKSPEWDIVRYLIDHQYLDATRIKTDNDTTLLHTIDDPDWTAYLIRAGLDADACNKRKNIPLETVLEEDPWEALNDTTKADHQAAATVLYIWTALRDKTAEEKAAIKQRISATFGPQALQKMKAYHERCFTLIRELLMNYRIEHHTQIPKEIVETLLMHIMRSPE